MCCHIGTLGNLKRKWKPIWKQKRLNYEMQIWFIDTVTGYASQIAVNSAMKEAIELCNAWYFH